MNKYVKFSGTVRLNRTEDIKKLAKKVWQLKNEFNVLKHYWKIRCRERKTYKYCLGEINQKMITIDMAIKKMQMLRPNAHTTRRGKQLYPLFLDHNSICRLRYFLNIKLR